MVGQNSLVNRNQKGGLTAYLTQDAVKNQINKVVGGKMGQDLFPVLYPQCRQLRHFKSAQTQVFYQLHY